MNLSPARFRLLVVAMFSVSFLGALDHTVVSTSLPTIAGDLNALTSMSWVFVGYTLASTVTLPVFAKLSDVVGARRVFLASLVLFLFASLACGFATDIIQLVVGRVIQGIGSAGVQLLSQTIIGTAVGPRDRPKYLGIIGVAFPVAILIGPVAGGIVTDTLGWRWVFWINVPVGIIAFALATISVPANRSLAHRRFDLAGTALLTVATTAIVLTCTWAGDEGPASPLTLIAGVVSLATIFALVLVERRALDPVVPLSELQHPTVLISTILAVVVGAGLFSVVSYVPTYVQMIYGTSATEAGLVPIATVFGMLISSVLTGWLVSRSGLYRAFPRIGTAVGGIGLLAMSQLPVGVPLWVPMLAMGVVGLGTGSYMNLVVAIAQSAALPAALGRITATVNMVRQTGATITTAIVGTSLGVGVAVTLPRGLDASSLTPAAVQTAGPIVAGQVALAYSTVFAPIFIGLATVHFLGLVASLLLPAHRLPERELSGGNELEILDDASIEGSGTPPVSEVQGRGSSAS